MLGKQYLKYVSSNILGMMGLSFYILADTYFVAAKLGADGLAALNIAIPGYSLVNATGLMVAMGGAVRYTIAQSQGQKKQAHEIFTKTMLTGWFFAAIYLMMGIFLAKPFAALLGAEGEILPMTADYLRMMLLFGVFFISNDMMLAFVRNDGAPRLAMIGMICGSLTNVVLDYALIFGHFGLPEMGIKGAAIASVIAEAASLLFFLIYTYITVDLKKYGLNRLRSFDPVLLMRILSISCFTMLQYFLSMATWFVFFVAVERLGQRELAIANIVRSIYIVMLIPVNALATTTNSLVSNAIGAGGINYVMPLINKIGRFSFLIMLGLVIITALFPQALLSVYTNETALINESVSSVYVICVAMLIASVANVVFNGISGTGNTQAALMLEAITIAIYGSYIIFIGMWVKAPIEWCFTIEILYYTLLLATSYIYFKKAKWQNKKI